MKEINTEELDAEMVFSDNQPAKKTKKPKKVKAPFVPGCDECELKVRKRVEPLVHIEEGAGERVLFVGESPTEDDIRDGELLSGQQGGLVNAMFEKYGPFSYAVTNVTMCYPGRGKKPKVKDIAHCDVFLRALIGVFQPTKIMCLGKLAAKAILGPELGNIKLYNMRERMPFEVDVPGDEGYTDTIADVYVSYSPKMVYKEPKYVDDFVADWDFMFNPPERTWIDPETTFLGGKPQEIIAGLEKYLVNNGISPFVALDFETTGLHPIKNRPVTIALSKNVETAVVVNLHDLTDLQMKRVLEAISRLTIPSSLIYHEAKFDMKFFKQWSGGIKLSLGWDTKLMDYVRGGNPEASRGLKYLARRRLYAPAYSKDITFDGDTDIREMAIYNGRDTATTLQLKNSYGRMTERESKLLTYLYEVTCMLVDAELKGAPIDEAWLKQRKVVLDKDMAEQQAKFDAMELNPNSPKQVKEFFGTKSGDKKALLKVIEEGDETKAHVAQAILTFRSASKELSTYVDGFLKHIVDGRIHTDYRVGGTKTGRLGSRDPNMQNLKSDDDEDHNYQAVVATKDPRKVVVHFDYSQIEMRRMAIESGDKRLLDLFMSGRDIHAELAKEIFGESFDPDSTNQRTRAKRTNFGIIYGISRFGLAEQLDIDEFEAQDYLDTWYRMYPGVVQWWESIKAQVRDERVVYTPFGRARRFELESLVVDENSMEREGINFPIQSPCCDMHLLAALHIYKQSGLCAVQFVHDELVYELDKKGISDTMDYITWSMKKTAEDLTGNVLSFPAEIKGE